MLQLLPAILILLIQGPSGLDRLAHDGRLPEALAVLRAISLEGDAPIDLSSDSDTDVLAQHKKSVFSSVDQLAGVLWLLSQIDSESEIQIKPIVDLSDSAAKQCALSPIPQKTRTAFTCSDRSRDGPRQA